MLRALTLTTVLFAAAMPTYAADVRVQVTDINKHTGTIAAVLMDSEAAWTGKGAPVSARREKAGAGTELELVFTDVAPGKYAIRLMHDENDNGKLDTNLVGMPTEGYGFSNNPRVMRAAHFDEAVFEVTEQGAAITIALR